MRVLGAGLLHGAEEAAPDRLGAEEEEVLRGAAERAEERGAGEERLGVAGAPLGRVVHVDHEEERPEEEGAAGRGAVHVHPAVEVGGEPERVCVGNGGVPIQQ